MSDSGDDDDFRVHFPYPREMFEEVSRQQFNLEDVQRAVDPDNEFALDPPIAQQHEQDTHQALRDAE